MLEKEVITEWFNKYSDEVYNFLIYYTGSADVDDIVQETFMKALNRIDSFKREASPKTWLISIARNVAIDEMRKREKERKKKDKAVKDLPLKQEQQTPETVYHLNETKKELYETIQTLKSSYRDVLILRGIKEYSVQETAAVLSWSESKVNVTFHRALTKLQKKVRGKSI